MPGTSTGEPANDSFDFTTDISVQHPRFHFQASYSQANQRNIGEPGGRHLGNIDPQRQQTFGDHGKRVPKRSQGVRQQGGERAHGGRRRQGASPLPVPGAVCQVAGPYLEVASQTLKLERKIAGKATETLRPRPSRVSQDSDTARGKVPPSGPCDQINLLLPLGQPRPVLAEFRIGQLEFVE